MDTLEGNKLIAEFVQFDWRNETRPVYDYESEFSTGWNNEPFEETDLEYHSSWDWLMPVWVKFDSLGLIHFSGIEMRKEYVMHRTFISQAILKGEVIAAFKLLSQAIKWYNRHQPKR